MKELFSTSLKIYPRKGSLLSLMTSSNFDNIYSFEICLSELLFLFQGALQPFLFYSVFCSNSFDALEINIQFFFLVHRVPIVLF